MKQLAKWLGTLLTCVLALTLCLFLLPTQTQAATEGDYTYTVSGGEAEITDVKPSISGAITVPSTLGGYPVTSIGGYAFNDCKSVESVSIPDSVINIGACAFYSCNALTNVTIPDSVSSIGSYAFYSCDSLASINIPDSITTINSYTFEYCTSLKKVVIPDGVIMIGSYAFSDCTNLLCLSIPEGISTIEQGAFYGCDLSTILYRGTQSQKERITIGGYNDPLNKATWHYVTETVCIHDYLCCTICGSSFRLDGTSVPMYTVQFKNWNGTVLSDTRYHQDDVVYEPEPPVRTNDKTYTYAFSGWDEEVVPCKGDTVYTAIYTPTYIDYTVTFKDWDGTVLSTGTYHYGDAVTAPETPTKAADETYTYPFAAWDKELICTGNDVITATYTPTYIDYTVTFKNWDGTVLSTATYHYGDTVAAPETPTKAADNTYIYPFTGWDAEVIPCAGDAVYTATYSREMIDYVVTFQNADSTVISQKTYHYGDTVEIPADPTRAADETYTYAFNRWDKEVTACAGNTVYTATYTPTYIDYTVIFADEDGTVISQKTCHYGDTVEIPTDFSAPEGYRFVGWDKEIVTAVDGNAVYTAIYELDWLKGDFDSSGSVDDADALYLLRHTLFADRYPIPSDGDVDNDGSVTDADALYLLRYTLFPDRYPLYPAKEEI